MKRLVWALALALAAHLFLLRLRLPESEPPELTMAGSGRVSVRLAAAPEAEVKEPVAEKPEAEAAPGPVQPEILEQDSVEPPDVVEIVPAPEETPSVREEPVRPVEPRAEKRKTGPQQRRRDTPSAEEPPPERAAAVLPDAAADAARHEIQALQPAEPLAVVNAPPDYPPLARRRGWEGTVLLEVAVDAGGRVESVRVARASSHSLLDREAVRAVSSWRFSPAVRNGVPVASIVQVPVHFILEEN